MTKRDITSLDEHIRQFIALSPADRARALCIFGLDLTVTARAIYYDDHPPELMVSRLRRINEHLHRIIGHAAHILGLRSDDASDASFLRMLIEDTEKPGRLTNAAGAWERAMTRVGNSDKKSQD